MTRTTAAAVTALALAALLTGCDPVAPVPTPTVPSSASATPATPSAVPSPLTLTIPGCDYLFSAEEVTSLMGASMTPTPSGATGRGTQFEGLRTILDAEGSVNCTWVLPATERGLTVSIVEASAATESAVRSTLSGAGATITPTGGPSVIFALSAPETPEGPAQSEADYLAAGIWVSVRDVNGEKASDLAVGAMAHLADLNPEWFATH